MSNILLMFPFGYYCYRIEMPLLRLVSIPKASDDATHCASLALQKILFFTFEIFHSVVLPYNAQYPRVIPTSAKTSRNGCRVQT